MGSRFAAFVLAATALSSVARAQAVPPSYIDTVNRYRAGEFAAAVSDLQGMLKSQVERDAQVLLRSREVAREIEIVRAAAMLHCEAGILFRANGATERPDDWDRAKAFMTVVETLDPHDPFVRKWRLLMTSFLQGQNDLVLAMDYARGTWRPRVRMTAKGAVVVAATTASSTLPGGLESDDDPELRLAVGAIHEAAWHWEHDSDVLIAHGDLDTASRELTQALALQPDLIEARIRLARVLTLNGKHDDAARVFADIKDAEIEPGFRYLVQLFRGDLAQRRGDFAAAEHSYAAAIETMPSASSARLALAELHHASGKRLDAAARVRALASEKDLISDPWLWYARGMAWRSQGYLEDLRRMIHPGTGR